MNGRDHIETVDLDRKELDAILARAKAHLPAGDYKWIEKLVRSHVTLVQLVKEKQISIRRLRQMLFGAKTEKTRTVLERARVATSGEQEKSAGAGETVSGRKKAKPKRKGHGRNGAAAYTGAERIAVPHESLKSGDGCPKCPKGKIYPLASPGLLVRVIGQPPLKAKVYEVQKLRCNLCGEVFTARLPQGVGTEKYDASAKATIALLKYGAGFPFHRLDRLECNFGIPLPATTQWTCMEEAARVVAPVHQELVHQGAQGEVVHNDDTPMRILAWMGQRRRDWEKLHPEDKSERTGIYTSGIVCKSMGRKIALFFTGRKHAGENLEAVLAKRAKGRDPPIQMCDGLSHNVCGDFESIVANCLTHGRRRFVDVIENFPEECKHLLETLREVYKNDAFAKKEKMSDRQRLEYHRENSGPLMKKLRKWFDELFEERTVEPNSSLGDAIRYMSKRWEKLTRFLEVPGVPLDNSICERALKKAILHRKNSYFYMSDNGARVGDMFMSLIHTCELNHVNAFEYVVALLNHPAEIKANPAQWMPWNYKDALARTVAA